MSAALAQERLILNDATGAKPVAGEEERNKPDVAEPLIRTLAIACADLDDSHIRSLWFCSGPPRLLVGFVSPYVDFATFADRLRAMLPADTPAVLVTTAGELFSSPSSALYRPTGEPWDEVVLQAFSRDLLEAADIHSVSLHSEDIRSGSIVLNHDQRVDRIRRDLDQLVVPFALDCRDTVALTFIDGAAASDGYFMEAVYAAGKFPLMFVGGLAGGRLDFRKTEIFDGRKSLENHAVIVFLKMAVGKRYGVFKTQSFKRTTKSYTLLDVDALRRAVSTTIDPETLIVEGFIDRLCRDLNCQKSDLERQLKRFTFAVDLDGELFVRSVARVDLQNDCIDFYCNVSPGDELYLTEETDFIDHTVRDYLAFIKDKPGPLGGIVNDCILRRLNNAGVLGQLDIFDNIPVAGYSSFGEIFGVPMNQTLAAVFFFQEESNGNDFNECFSRFPLCYASYHNYFTKIRRNRLGVLNRLRQRLIQHIVDHAEDPASWSRIIRQIGSCADLLAGDDSGAIAGAAVELHAVLREASREREAAREALLRREMELRVAEERRLAAEARIALEAQLRQAQRLEALGRMAGGLAHELNNILQPIIGLTELVMEDLGADSDAHQNLAIVVEAAQRARNIATQVLSFGRPAKGKVHPVPLAATMRTSLSLLGSLLKPCLVLSVNVRQDDVVVGADETQLTQIIINIVRNAIDATGDCEGSITVNVDRVWVENNRFLSWPKSSNWFGYISISDTGHGMSQDTLSHVFDPFFTTKAVGEGSGLGLSVVYGIIKEWGGHIDVESEIGKGTTVHIYIATTTSQQDM